MSKSPLDHFVPNWLWRACIAVWVLLTAWSFWTAATAKDYPLLVLVYGCALLAVGMAAIVVWVMVFVSLVINWCSSRRRQIFRSQLNEMTVSFTLVTIILVLLVVLTRGD